MKVIKTYGAIPFELLLTGRDKEAFTLLSTIDEQLPVVQVDPAPATVDEAIYTFKKIAKKADMSIMTWKLEDGAGLLVQRYFGGTRPIRMMGSTGYKAKVSHANQPPEVLAEALDIWREKGKTVADWEKATGSQRAPYINGAISRLKSRGQHEGVRSPEGLAANA